MLRHMGMKTIVRAGPASHSLLRIRGVLKVVCAGVDIRKCSELLVSVRSGCYLATVTVTLAKAFGSAKLVAVMVSVSDWPGSSPAGGV